MKNKTYSLKYSKWKAGKWNEPCKQANSETTVPRELFIDKSIVQRMCFRKSISSRSGNNEYGFRIPKEYADKIHYFYIDTSNTYSGNDSGKIVFVNFDQPQKVSGDYENSRYFYWVAAVDWTVALVVENTKRFINCEDDKYIYFILPDWRFPVRKVKVFDNTKDRDENKIKNDKKAREIRTNKWKSSEETNNGPICMSTPKMEVVEINYKTDSLPNVKVGDVIYGELDVVDENGKSKIRVASSYVSYIKVYVNNEHVNTLQMSKFGEIMADNYKLKRI